MSRFDDIRHNRRVPAKRNGIVTYRGTQYRITNISSTGGLVLRSEAIVHPNDPELDYTNTSGVHKVRQHIIECRERIKMRLEDENAAEFERQNAEETAFMQGLEMALKHMGIQP